MRARSVLWLVAALALLASRPGITQAAQDSVAVKVALTPDGKRLSVDLDVETADGDFYAVMFTCRYTKTDGSAFEANTFILRDTLGPVKNGRISSHKEESYPFDGVVAVRCGSAKLLK